MKKKIDLLDHGSHKFHKGILTDDELLDLADEFYRNTKDEKKFDPKLITFIAKNLRWIRLLDQKIRANKHNHEFLKNKVDRLQDDIDILIKLMKSE